VDWVVQQELELQASVSELEQHSPVVCETVLLVTLVVVVTVGVEAGSAVAEVGTVAVVGNFAVWVGLVVVVGPAVAFHNFQLVAESDPV